MSEEGLETDGAFWNAIIPWAWPVERIFPLHYSLFVIHLTNSYAPSLRQVFSLQTLTFFVSLRLGYRGFYLLFF